MTSQDQNNTAWIAGASGLIGQHLLEQLCLKSEYSKVIAFVRKGAAYSVKHKKLQYFECDWEALTNDTENYAAPTEQVDALFCALGSTKKKTPDPAIYKRIDIEYPEAFARLGRSNGARFYGLVSANGAGGKLPSAYLEMKKEVETCIRECDYPSIAIARPSLLLGDRSEFRLGEKASEFVCKLLPGNLKAVHSKDVAAALIKESLTHEAGCRILESGQMQGASH